MLPQLGFSEIVVLALLAIIVVGPKDLPKMMRAMGQFMAKVKGLGQEFKDAFAEMSDAEEIAQMRRDIEDLKALGKAETYIGDIDQDGLGEEMRALDRDIRAATDMSSPKGKTSGGQTPEGKT